MFWAVWAEIHCKPRDQEKQGLVALIFVKIYSQSLDFNIKGYKHQNPQSCLNLFKRLRPTYVNSNKQARKWVILRITYILLHPGFSEVGGLG